MLEAPASEAVALIRDWLASSSRVLIGAGAGLSVAAGIDYADQASFARLFPAMVRRGFRARYQLIGYEGLSPAAFWGYWASHVHDVRFTDRVAPVYQVLRHLVRDKDYFVLTSNVDAMFARNGFDGDRLFTPQGDYAWMQCMTHGRRACADTVWPSRPIIDQLRMGLDPVTQEVVGEDVVPQCPTCAGDVFMNVRLTRAFVESPYADQSRRLAAWARDSLDAPLLVLEIGAGFNTPSVVRWPLEGLVAQHPHARFVRINLDHPEVPAALAERSVGLPFDAMVALSAIDTA